MALHYRTRGLIFKKNDKGEADQIFGVYTKDFGKLSIMGRAIRKSASKLRGGADLFYLSDIEFIQGKTQKTLIDAILIDSFFNIKQDFARFQIAHRLAEILDTMIIKEERDEQSWQLINEVFEKLDIWQAKSSKLEILSHYFYWNLSAILGYRPVLTSQSLANQPIDEDLAKILKLFLQKDWPLLMRLKIQPNHYDLLQNISEWYNKDIITVGYEK